MSNTVFAGARFAFCVSLVLVSAHTQAADLYVSTLGSDSSPGTSAQPFRTITYAYSKASAGTTLHVLPGVYYDYTSAWGIHLGKSGTASSPIVLHSETRGGAIIDGQNASDRADGFYIDGNYNTVDGFVIRNCPLGGMSIWANGNRILNNEIHHNGNPANSSSNGRDGVYSNEGTSGNYYAGNYIHDNGRSGSNLDHGLYLCGQNEVVINNVLFRNASSGLQIAGYTTVSNMKVYNNVMAWNGTQGIILWMSLNGVDIKNNIIYANSQDGVLSYGAHGSGVVFDHNLNYGNGSANYDFTAGGSDYSYTLGTTISADPRLVSDASASFDPHLGSGSPAIGAGMNLSSTTTTDQAGTARPASGAWDLGAYIYATGNTPPTISSIANQTVTVGSSTGPLPFTVSDPQTSAANLTVSGSSSDPTLVPNANIVLGGSGGSRTLAVTPPSGQTGTVTITLTVSSGSLSASTSFTLTVNAPTAPTVVLTSPASGASYGAPATLSLVASVTANGHEISKVQFYEGAKLLAEATDKPYAFTYTNVSTRSCAFKATTVYDSGSIVSSPDVTVMVTNVAPVSGLTFASTSGVMSAPFYITNNAIVQPDYTTVTAGGQAVYTFAVPGAGSYVVSALINAPSGNNNSFFLNIDDQPTDPLMIWDAAITSGLVSQTVSWRGNGTDDGAGTGGQYTPKVFSLAAGNHQLIIRGREGNCQLGTITIAPYGVSTPPAISSVTDQTISAGGSAGPLAFTVNDAETLADNLTVTASSSNPTLVPNANIVLEGSGADRMVTVTPVSGETGTATITLTVSDSSLSVSTSFTVMVNAVAAPTVTLTSPADGANYGAAATVNLTASVTANGRTITKVQFYDGTTLLGEDVTTPYTFCYDNVSTGTCALKATVVYDSGSTVSSAPVSVTVNPVAPLPTVRITLQAANLQIRWQTNCGNYILQSRTITGPTGAWVDVTNIPVIDQDQCLVEDPASGAGRLYKLRGQ